MNTVFIYNDKLNESISNLLSHDKGNLYIYLDNIDIEGVKYLKRLIKNKENVTILISISNKTITRSVLKGLYEICNEIYYYNNNDTSCTINSNMVMYVDHEDVEVMFVIPSFEKEVLEKSDNISFYLKGELKDGEIKQLFDKINSRKDNYLTLTEDAINELEEINDLRNDKASTLTSLVSRDEIKKSFRKIKEVEDSDAFLKMIEMNSEIKYKGDDILMNDGDSNTKIDITANDEIEIDLGE
ncbi:MAG: hypothetical protein Q4D02_03815 [Clostridia bacterium]|nr:hypothetical protein [Clostridia bacterium]